MPDVSLAHSADKCVACAELDLHRDSPALGRLIEEVRNEDGEVRLTAYNRTYHRHNR